MGGRKTNSYIPAPHFPATLPQRQQSQRESSLILQPIEVFASLPDLKRTFVFHDRRMIPRLVPGFHPASSERPPGGPQRVFLTASLDIFDGSPFLLEAVLRYNSGMTAKLTKELAAALHATGDRELKVVDPDTSRVYFIVESEMHRQAMDALRRQQDRDSIAQGIAEMEAGQGIPLAEARKLTRDRLLARKQ